MLDSTFKKLHLVSSFIVLEQGKVIAEKYDKKNLVPHVIKMSSLFAPLI
jgi:apolipoprotein N-acyltransferase